MSESPSFRVELMRETVSWAEKLDELSSQSTIRLDDKSQQTGAVAGVFLAAALSFLKPDSLSGLGRDERLLFGGLLFAAVSVLVCCVATCLSVNWLRFVPSPITLEVMESLTEDVAAHADGDLDAEVKLAVYRERLKLWKVVLADRLALNKTKAARLKTAQVFLAAGMFIVSALLLLTCWVLVTGVHH